MPNQMPAFTGHTWQGVCTHRDADKACGCVHCDLCGVVMIECANARAMLPCEARVEVVSLDDAIARLQQLDDWGPGLRENKYQHAYRMSVELDWLVDIEARLRAGDEVTIIHRHGRYVRYVL